MTTLKDSLRLKDLKRQQDEALAAQRKEAKKIQKQISERASADAERELRKAQAESESKIRAGQAKEALRIEKIAREKAHAILLQGEKDIDSQIQVIEQKSKSIITDFNSTFNIDKKIDKEEEEELKKRQQELDKKLKKQKEDRDKEERRLDEEIKEAKRKESKNEGNVKREAEKLEKETKRNAEKLERETKRQAEKLERESEKNQRDADRKRKDKMKLLVRSSPSIIETVMYLGVLYLGYSMLKQQGMIGSVGNTTWKPLSEQDLKSLKIRG